MSRPIRIEFPGAFYHVMAHGAGKQWLYSRREHLGFFIDCLVELRRKYGVLVHAAVLMRNHYHLVIETPAANLSRAMKRFNSEFVRKMNANLNRHGPLFQQRYKAVIVEKDEYFLALIRYVAQNPVRIGVVRRCEDYEGGFLEWMQDRKKKEAIYWEGIKREFGGKKDWQARLLKVVNDGIEESPYKSVIHPVILGSKVWAEAISRKYPISRETGKIGVRQYNGISFSEGRLNEFLKKLEESHRDEIELWVRYEGSGKTIGEIQESMKQKSYHSTAQKLYRIRRRIQEDNSFRKMAEECLRYVKC